MSRHRYSNERFLRELDENIVQLMSQGNVSIDALAKIFAISGVSFSRRVKTVTGQTAAVYITSVRLAEAKRMLVQSPRYTVLEVALHCGFSDNAHFTHVFRRMEGITPSEYVHRQQALLAERRRKRRKAKGLE